MSKVNVKQAIRSLPSSSPLEGAGGALKTDGEASNMQALAARQSCAPPALQISSKSAVAILSQF